MLTRVQNLPEAQRETLFLVYVEGLTYREAAAVLDVPIGTVMSRLAGARERLAVLNGERQEEGMMVTSMAEFSPPTDADLVAYLDGELDEAARQAVAEPAPRRCRAARAGSTASKLDKAATRPGLRRPSRRRAEGPARGNAGARRGSGGGRTAGEPPVATGR